MASSWVESTAAAYGLSATRNLCLGVLSAADDDATELVVRDGVPALIGTDAGVLRRLLLLLLEHARENSCDGERVALVVSSHRGLQNYTFAVTFRARTAAAPRDEATAAARHLARSLGTELGYAADSAAARLWFDLAPFRMPLLGAEQITLDEACTDPDMHHLRKAWGLGDGPTPVDGEMLSPGATPANTTEMEFPRGRTGTEPDDGWEARGPGNIRTFRSAPADTATAALMEVPTEAGIDMDDLPMETATDKIVLEGVEMDLLAAWGLGSSPPVNKGTFLIDREDSLTEVPTGNCALESAEIPPQVCALNGTAPTGTTSPRPPHVLVVEDTDVCARLVRMQLRKLGCTSARAENGEVALDLLRASQPGTYGLVLMDLRMPVMDGFEATVAIKKYLGLDVPVVALTAEASATLRARCTEKKFDGYLTVPWKSHHLEAVLREHTLI